MQEQEVKKLLPFSLKDALEGATVVTRDGRKVSSIKDTGQKLSSYPLMGVIVERDGMLSGEAWMRNGRYSGSEEIFDSDADLFMLDTSKG